MIKIVKRLYFGKVDIFERNFRKNIKSALKGLRRCELASFIRVLETISLLTNMKLYFNVA